MKKLLQNAALILMGIITSIILCEAVLYIIDKPRFYKKRSLPVQYKVYNIDEPDLKAIHYNWPSKNIELFYEDNPRGYCA